MWETYNRGESIGAIGSENGKIIFDEEYPGYSRITVEVCEKYYAITVGLYGSMVHTVFCSNTEYERIVSSMKSDIQEFCYKKRSMSEESDFCDSFYEKY